MTTKKTRKTHTAEFKAEALKLAERVGVAEAARQLKIYESQLYNWRTAIERKSNTSERIPQGQVLPRAPKTLSFNLRFSPLQKC